MHTKCLRIVEIPMKEDIVDRRDVEKLVRTFYDSVFEDTVIGYIFTEVADVDWDAHFPVMFDFWEMVLFGKANYKGNPMTKHIDLNRTVRLSQDHFDRWLELWGNTIDSLFEGERAEMAKSRAKSMALLMMHKIEETN